MKQKYWIDPRRPILLLLLALAACSSSKQKTGDGGDARPADTRREEPMPEGRDAGNSTDVGGPTGDAPDERAATADAGLDLSPETAADGSRSDSSVLDGGPCSLENTLTPAESAAYFPFRVGTRWIYRGRSSNSTSGSANAFLQSREITAMRAIGTATAMVVRNSNPDGNGASIEEYVELTPTGLINHGNNAPPDAFPANATFYVAPYTDIKLPIQVCSTYETFSKAGLASARDLDGDGLNETIAVRSTKTVRLETVSVPQGQFPNALRVDDIQTTTTTYSKSGTTVSSDLRVTDWYAANVGPIKRSFVAQNLTYTFDLIAYTTGPGTGHGFVPQGALTRELSQARSNPYAPNRPTISFDGKQFLVLLPTSVNDARLAGYNGNVHAILVGLDGKPTKSVPLLDSSSAVNGVVTAFDGTRHMVAYNNAGRVEGLIVSTDAVTLDGPLIISNNMPVTLGTTESSGGPSVVPVKDGFLAAFVKWGNQNGITSPNLWFVTIDVHGHPLAHFRPFPDARQTAPVLATDGTTVLALWTVPGPSLTDPLTLAAARFAPDGHPIDGAPIPIATATDARYDDLDLIFNGTHYVAAWTQTVAGRSTVQIARISAGGMLLDGPPPMAGKVVGIAENTKTRPRLSRFGGQSVIIWERRSPAGSFFYGGISGSRFTNDGVLSEATMPTLGLDDGLWVLGPYAKETFSQNPMPGIGWGGDRALVVWAYPPAMEQAETLMVNLDHAFGFPW